MGDVMENITYEEINEIFQDYWCKKCEKPVSYPKCCDCGSSVKNKDNIIIIETSLAGSTHEF